MASVEAPIMAPRPLSAWRRLLRLMARSALAAAVATGAYGVVKDTARLTREERLFDFPLVVALEKTGVSVAQSELLVVAPIEQGPMPSFARLKEVAAGIARGMPGGDQASLWSDASDGFAAVYYEGVEPNGGKWIVSARFIAGEGGEGVVEATVHRSLLGFEAAMPRLARSAAGAVARAIGRPVPGMRAEVVYKGRPPRDVSPVEWSRRLFAELGGELRYQSTEGDRYTAAGFAPRLPGRTQFWDQTVNVVVSVSRLGAGQWTEVETPVL